jgi:predicted outer membrane repeat protein
MVAAAVFLVLGASVGFAHGRTITVDDDGPADFSTIQAAIDDANDGDTVEIQPGTYTGWGNRNIWFGGKAITVRATEPNDLEVVAATVVDCNNSGTGFVFQSGEDANSVLAGLTITNGHANHGSGILISAGGRPPTGPVTCRIINCVIVNCTSEGHGGAIYCYESAPTIANCTISSASAGDEGGAIYCEEGAPTIAGCIISSNSAGGLGGAIYCEQGNPIIDNCVFNSNCGQIGGAIYLLESTSEISRCTFRDNSATEWSGGAVRINESAVTITDSIFEKNTAQSGGGAINCSGDGPELSLNNCVFRGCSAPIGGALCGVARPMTITNCIFAGNWTAETERRPFSEGGALAIGGGSMANCLLVGNTSLYGGAMVSGWCRGLTITNCTFAANRAFQANSLYFDWPMGIDKLYGCPDGNISIANSIVWDGQDTIVSPADDVTITLAFCDVSGGQSSVHDPYDCVTWGPSNIDAEPCFADAGYWDPNGTPEDANDDFWVDGNYHLKSQAGRWDANEARWTIDEVTSPCIDAGDPMSPVGFEPFPNGGIINMGAYGGTSEASKSYFGKPSCETIIAGDINGDCKVNFLDFWLMALHWLEER